MRVAGALVVTMLVAACATGSRGGGIDEGPNGEPCAAGCDGHTLVECVDGERVETPCDPALGLSCHEGACFGACHPDRLGDSYIGCEYFPTVTGNEVAEHFDFGVAVSNTSTSNARVTFDGGALDASIEITVAPNTLVMQRLPWVPELKGCMEAIINPFTSRCETDSPGALAAGGAYRVRSTAPATVYQFNPVDYFTTEPFGLHSYTNDASLLLPSNAWRHDYLVASFQSWFSGYAEPGLMAITAREDDTLVTITSTAPTREIEGKLAPLVVGQPAEVVLMAGDVLQLMTYEGDFTGTRVKSDKAIQLIAGHYCTRVPLDIAACDHLEESMFPVETLGNDYLLTAPAISATSGVTKARVIRVAAVDDNTEIAFDPPLADAPPILSAGRFFETPLLDGDYRVTSTQRILVAQYMAGLEADGETGDPAMALGVTAQQFRDEYVFVAPTTYETSFVNVVAPLDAQVTLDGTPVETLSPIGASGFGVARLTLSNASGGTHFAEADAPFGISVYGYGAWTSYWYPGGLDLEAIEIEPPR